MTDPRSRPLQGRVIAFLESRRAEELTRMIERAGGMPVGVPVIREVPIEDRGEIRAWLATLGRGGFDVVIFLTGDGCRDLLARAEEYGLLADVIDALSRARVVARGPKPAHVLRQRSIPITFIPPEPNTSDELLAELSTWNLVDVAVGLQVYGGASPALDRLRDGLRNLGARVQEVAPYRWEGPTDLGPVRALIDGCLSRQIDALALLSASHVDGMFAVADEDGRGEALRAALNDPRMIVAAIGPVTARAVEERGIRVDVLPEHPKMGHLVKALESALALR